MNRTKTTRAKAVLLALAMLLSCCVLPGSTTRSS